MIRILLPVLLTSILAGCASISNSMPKCDGYSRRPLNRAMWQWEDKEKLTNPVDERSRAPAIQAVPYAEGRASVTPVAFAGFDDEGSSSPCEGR